MSVGSEFWRPVWESKAGDTIAALSGRSTYTEAQRKLLADEAARLLDLRPEDSLLEVGCAAGFTGELLIPRVSEYAGVDYNEAALERFRERVPEVDVYGDSATRLVFPAESFSKALMGSVLLCMDFDECRAALRELRRVTISRALISGNLDLGSGVKVDPSRCDPGCTCHMHATWFSREALIDMARGAGWGWAETHDIHPDLTPHSRIMFDLVVGA